MKYKSSPLQWAGSKQKALDNILPIINKFEFNTFVEPFIGAANVSLNVEAKSYVWSDSNNDLINTYECIANNSFEYIKYCKYLFQEYGFDAYNALRDQFNNITYPYSHNRAALFQYLNKHGFNGLCRYNSKGKFNVPRGTVTKKPKEVPIEGIENISNLFKNNRVNLFYCGFEETFNRTNKQSDKILIYSDPPYVPLTTDFKYTKDGFNKEDHIKLKELSKYSPHNAMISNHWTEFTEELYSDADEVHLFDVQRTISCKGDERKKVKECLVVYYGDNL